MDEFIIHARNGLQTPFMSQAWLDAVKAVVEDAHRHHMRVWIYDEVDWPSGIFGGKIPLENEDFREHRLDENGQLQTLEGFEGDMPGRNVDYLNRAATDEFIRQCYEPYVPLIGQYFGNTVRGFFNDEVRFFHARPWSTSLTEPVPDGGRYFERLGELMAQNFFGPISRWCEAHNLELIGHVMGEETLGSQVRYVGNPYPIINLFHQPGVDHLGTTAEGLHPRLPASIAHLNGNRPVTSETFAGHPWDFGVEDLFRVSGWLYAAGVTKMILHGFFYAENKNDWPPDIFYRWKNWNDIGRYMEWSGRVQHFLAQAQPVCRVALYVPLPEFWDDYQPDTDFTIVFVDGPLVGGERARRLHLAMEEIGKELVRRGIDFDYVPAPWLQRVEDRLLILPFDSQVEFAGQRVQQGDRSAAACVDEIEALLSTRLRVTGLNSQPNPNPPSDRLSDPYLHTKPDEGGIHTKSFLWNERPAHLVWNANPEPFNGQVELVEKRAWLCWRPDTGEYTDLGIVEVASIDLPPYRMTIFIGAE